MVRTTVKDLVNAVHGTLLSGDETVKVSDITLNSRDIKEGDLFVPIIGERVDAHRFIRQAFEDGAAAAFTSEHDPDNVNELVDGLEEKSPAVIAVDDTVRALQDVGRYCRDRLNIIMIGVTGSVGKTTTREMIGQALGAGYRVFKTPRNFNSQVGVPVSISEISRKDQAAVLELGMSEPGELSVIARIARPDMAVITNIGIAHIEQLGTKERILEEKLTIQEGMSDGGILFLNGDDPYLKNVKAREGLKTIYFGTGDNCDYRASDISLKDGFPQFTAICKGKMIPLQLKVPGAHQVINAMASLAVADACGVPLVAAAQQLSLFKGFKHRQQICELRDISVIDDSYNSSPVSACAAIDILSLRTKAKRRIALMGDMLELGSGSPKFHREVGEYIGEHPVDILITYGDLSGYIEEGAKAKNPDIETAHFPSGEESKAKMQEWLLNNITPGDCILIKGSNSLNLGEVVENVCQYNR